MSLYGRIAARLPGTVANRIEDLIESAERRGRESSAVQRFLIWLHECTAGYTSSLTRREINLCAVAITLRQVEGDQVLRIARDHPSTRYLRLQFSPDDWEEIVREAANYVRSTHRLISAYRTRGTPPS
jgi:hypothetical protein